MGKLGARELNYSSDVDLVLLYDPAAPIYTERSEGHAIGGFTTRIARGLVSLMEARDADGYVFRTDLRLRPDPAVTPPAVALPAAIAYYESMGQNWERAAMIKARPVAGDLALGRDFLEAIRPFVWRRGLDFAAVADIHAMKRRIDEHRGGALAAAIDPVARVAGHNVKLGEGGIREIEFLAQTLQLVWGGRDPGLRVPTTLGALRLLARAGHVPRRAANELASAYRFLRRVEHRLQMVADRQVHELPRLPAEFAHFAMFMGDRDTSSFAVELLRNLGQVRARYAEVFELVPEPLEPDASSAGLDFSGVDAPPAATEAALKTLGFANPQRIVVAVRGWQAGHVRALRSGRARDLLAQMLPRILGALARQAQPDTVFNRFDAFLARQPAGVQLLSLFQRNPGLLDRIAAVPVQHPRWPIICPIIRPLSMAFCRWRRIRILPACCACASRMHGCSRTPSRSSAARFARRISPSRSEPWREGWTLTPPDYVALPSPMPRSVPCFPQCLPTSRPVSAAFAVGRWRWWPWARRAGGR